MKQNVFLIFTPRIGLVTFFEIILLLEHEFELMGCKRSKSAHDCNSLLNSDAVVCLIKSTSNYTEFFFCVCVWLPHNCRHLCKRAEKQFSAILTRVPALLFSYLQQQNCKSNEAVIVFGSGMHSLFITCVKFCL